MAEKKPIPGTGGDHYIPYAERTGGESIVFLTCPAVPTGWNTTSPLQTNFFAGILYSENLPLIWYTSWRILALFT